MDFFLSYAEVVGDAVEADYAGLGVVSGEGGSPVAVAGLAYGSGIDQVMAILAQRPIGRFRLADGAIRGAVGFADLSLQGEAALQVSVPEKRDGDRVGEERLEGVADAD
jgi:hypothetical protein